MHATMDDIARKCGVSKKTVSRVFANSDAVTASTRNEVLAAAKHLRYEVNIMARNLTRNESGFIGVATPFNALLGGSYFADAIRGVRRAITDDSGFILALLDTNSDTFNEGSKLAKLYRQRRVDGLLVLALHTNKRFLSTLARLHVPMVVVGEIPPASGVCSVSCDDKHGINLLCSHLYALGHRRIALLEGPTEHSAAYRRKQAFIEFARDKNLVDFSSFSLFLPPGDTSLHTAARNTTVTLLETHPRPTAIVAFNDTMALGAMEGARSLGLRVPEDVSVTGFDDDVVAKEYSPSLTTIHQPIFEMGEQSARMLSKAISTHTLPSGNIKMELSLVIRESTAPANSPIHRSNGILGREAKTTR
jgi:DNA-binding LacI/PurR family transcriptional regulator